MRKILAIALVTTLSPSARAQTPIAATITAAERADAVSLTAIFDVLHLPSVRGKPFVIYNAGAGSVSSSASTSTATFRYLVGFVTRKSDDGLEIAATTLSVEPGGRQAAVWDWTPFRDQVPCDRPLPGETRPLDFDDVCESFLAERDPYESRALADRAGDSLPRGVEAALRARWALERGEDALAVRLAKFSRKRIWRWETVNGVSRDVLPDHAIAEEITVRWRARSIEAALGGIDRSALLEQWRAISALPESRFSPEAASMVARYTSLIAEDVTWTALPDSAVGALSPAKQAEYRIHSLRDLNAMLGAMGYVDILAQSEFGKIEGNAASKLAALGMMAVPQLIAHLDDTRPTRSGGSGRIPGLESLYLLRVCDCCQQILRAIARGSSFEERMIEITDFADGDCVAARRRGEAWWKELQAKGEAPRAGATR